MNTSLSQEVYVQVFTHPMVTRILRIQDVIRELKLENYDEAKYILLSKSNWHHSDLEYILKSINQFITRQNKKIFQMIIAELMINHFDYIRIWTYLNRKACSSIFLSIIPDLIFYQNNKNQILDTNKNTTKIVSLLQNDSYERLTEIPASLQIDCLVIKTLNEKTIHALEMLGVAKLTVLQLAALFSAEKCFSTQIVSSYPTCIAKQKQLLYCAIIGGCHSIIYILTENYHISIDINCLQIAILSSSEELYSYCTELVSNELTSDELIQLIDFCFENNNLACLKLIIEERKGDINLMNIFLAASKNQYGIIIDILIQRFNLELINRTQIFIDASKSKYYMNILLQDRTNMENALNEIIRCPGEPPSIPNIGNSCYMAVIIQLLINMNCFSSAMKERILISAIDDITIIFIYIYSVLYIEETNTIDLTPFFYFFEEKYVIGEMNDANEFFDDIIHKLGLHERFSHSDNKDHQKLYRMKRIKNSHPIESIVAKTKSCKSLFVASFARFMQDGSVKETPLNVPKCLEINGMIYALYSMIEWKNYHYYTYIFANDSYYLTSDNYISTIQSNIWIRRLAENQHVTMVAYLKMDEIIHITSRQNQLILPPNCSPAKLYLWQLNEVIEITIEHGKTKISHLKHFLHEHIFSNLNINLIEFEFVTPNGICNWKITDDTVIPFISSQQVQMIPVYFPQLKLHGKLFSMLKNRVVCMHLEAVCCKCKESFPSCDIITHEENCSMDKVESHVSVDFKIEDVDSCSPFICAETFIMKDDDEDLGEYGPKLPDFNSDQKFYQKLWNVNLEKLLKILDSKIATFNFLLEVGHIGHSSICSCGHFMVLEKDKKSPLWHRLRCHKCRKSKGILEGTIYQNNKIVV